MDKNKIILAAQDISLDKLEANEIYYSVSMRM